jgi:hypothetical protein
MSSGSIRVEADEFVLRRIHQSHCDPALPVAIFLAAFRPTKADTAGLSVFREKEISAEQVAASGRKPDEYYVARLHVEDLQALGLSVERDELPLGPRGHAVIPEISTHMYQSDKGKCKAIMIELARLASSRIVYCPRKV